MTSSARFAGRWEHRRLLDPPPHPARPQHHLQRPAEAPVANSEREQRLAARGAHRTEVGERAHAGAAPQFERPARGWRSGRRGRGQGAGSAARRAPSIRSHSPRGHRRRHPRQLAGVKRAVAIDETNDPASAPPAARRRRRRRSRIMARRRPSAPSAAASAAGAIGGAVVDDDRAETRRASPPAPRGSPWPRPEREGSRRSRHRRCHPRPYSRLRRCSVVSPFVISARDPPGHARCIPETAPGRGRGGRGPPAAGRDRRRPLARTDRRDAGVWGRLR